MNKIIIANTLSLISNVVYMASYFRKNKHQIVSLFLVCNICDIVQYILLNKYSAVSRNTISFISNIVFIKWKNNFLVLLFALIKIGLMILNFDSVINIVMMILILANAISVAFCNEQTMRLISICDSFVWMIFDYSIKAYIASLGDIFTIVVILISYLKYKRLLK